MKKVITTVGASLFTNYRKENRDIDVHIDAIEDKAAGEYQAYTDRIDRIKSSIADYLKDGHHDSASAEIDSLMKISKMHKDITVYLLSTDTISSRIASELLKELLASKGFKVNFNEKQDVISGLQVNDSKAFMMEGLSNLINRINGIADGYYENIIFNITGGYKGIIPYMTILAIVNSCDIVYKYEFTDSLLTIPQLPVIINDEIFNKFFDLISKLENGIEPYSNEKNNRYKDFEELEGAGLVEIADNMAILSPIGKIFLNSYRSKKFVFFCPDEVWEDINKQNDIIRILKKKFCNKEIRENNLEKKQDHYVYDDGDNNNRIYYFEKDNLIYIYKTFQDEEAAKNFISHKIDKDNITARSKKRELDI